MAHGENEAARTQGRGGCNFNQHDRTVLTGKNGRGRRSESLRQGKWSRNREQQVLSPGVGAHLGCRKNKRAQCGWDRLSEVEGSRRQEIREPLGARL